MIWLLDRSGGQSVMAKSNPTLINALRETANLLEQGAKKV